MPENLINVEMWCPLGSKRLLRTHPPEKCAGRACPVHNVRMSDAPPQPSDSPSACKARSTPSAGSETPLKSHPSADGRTPGGGEREAKS